MKGIQRIAKQSAILRICQIAFEELPAMADLQIDRSRVSPSRC